MKTPVIQNEPEDLPGLGTAIVPSQEVADPKPSSNGGAQTRRWGRRKLVIGGLALAGALVVGIAVVTKSDSVATGPATADGRPDFAAIDRFVRGEMDAQRIPGLGLAIVQGDRIVHLRGFGKADQSGRKVTPQTLFYNGSTTKSFTALAIMQLREAGKLDLNAPVQRYLPWWRVADANASARITVRHLLYQVSGLSKATGNAHATSAAAGASALEDQVRELRTAKLTAKVGTTWQYSNANYNTLGMVVQAVSGQRYATYVRQHILEPLAMDNSVMSVTAAKKRGLVTGYRYWFGFPFAADLPYNYGNLPAGGLISTVEDMAHYMSAEVNGGRYGTHAVVSPAGMAELQRAGVPTGHAGVSYAMGWDVHELDGIPTISHDGSQFNAHANLVLIPEGKWGVILMENAENSPDEFFGARRMSGIADGVTRMVNGRQPGSTGSNTTLFVVFGLVFAVIGLQITGIVRSVRKFRRWRTGTGRRPRGFLRIGLLLGPPLVLSLAWAFLVLIALPQKVGAPLSALLMGMPDLGYMLLGSVVVALGWGMAKVAWAGRVLHSRAV